MALPDISLAQFNRIASGDYNAGQIDFRTDDNGMAELVKVNNHVWTTSKNNVELAPERILEVKETFLNALRKGGVGAEALKQIRSRLGLPDTLSMPADKEQRDVILTARFTPLTRAQVRSILDEFANEGKGFTQDSRAELSYGGWEAGQATRRMSASRAAARDEVNRAVAAAHAARKGEAVNYGITDALSLLSDARPLADLDAARGRRCVGANAVNERQKLHTALVNTFQGLVGQALKLLPANVRETGAFKLAGETVNIVKDDNGRLSAIVGTGNLATRVDLKMDADNFVARLIGKVVNDKETLGTSAAKNILNIIYDRDLEGGLVASDRTSLSRQFACLILEHKAEDAVNLVRGNYNTGILVDMAERVLGGEHIADSKKMLDDYHAKLVSDNASLPEEMKLMLGKVANVPFLKPGDGVGEFLVKAPIVGDIGKAVDAIPPPPGIVPTVPQDIGGLDGIKDFVADLVFSDDTMVGDVSADRPGEAIRRLLSDDRNVVALAEIIKNPDLIDLACAPQIADAVKDGIGKMVDILDAAFKNANGGKELAGAATENDFVQQLSLFLRDHEKLPGASLVQFDSIILSMANRGCEKIQLFINDVFKVGNVGVNDQGGIVNDPYKGLSAAEIGEQLRNKSLNQILDSAANADAPGQVGFFRQVIATYFTSLGKADKRSCFAAAMRYAQTFDFTGLTSPDEIVSAQKVAVNKFTGAILKGTSPLLQKMMQGLPRDIMGEYADALDDMKSSLAPIPRKIVQAHFMRMIEESKGKGNGMEIESITLEKSLGAASVGEAFLCSFKLKGEAHPKKFVVKIMRHDAERRVKAEAEIFTAAAEKIGPGMAKTWEGQLKQYMTEFDFCNEAANVNTGVGLYNIANTKDHPLGLIAGHVASMKMSTVVEPKKDVMVAEVARGKPVDKLFKEKVAEIRKITSSVFEQDAATGRVKWVDGPVDPKTGKPKKVPVVKAGVTSDILPNMIEECRQQYRDVKESQHLLVQATKAWFHEALLGSGKFHGDTHSGNLMIGGGRITFIDFGNLYTLVKRDKLDAEGNVVMDPRTNTPVQIDERHELLRIITGAAFRDKQFILEGFENLLSPAGKAALAANHDKVVAVLDSLLTKGRFSYDMVYRLNAVVSELQKLGLELPPAINCFVQSMARLSNSLSEMNTIINQTSILLEAANAYVPQGPAPQRDELDIFGLAFDFRASPEGKVLVEDDESIVGLTKNGVPVPITAFCHALTVEGFGGHSIEAGAFQPGGSYHNAVVNRVAGAQDSVKAAGELVAILRGHLNAGHISKNDKGYIETLEGDVISALTAELGKADTPEKRTAAISTFATQYCSMIKLMFAGIQESEGGLVHMRTFELVEGPSSFANAVMTTLMDNFDALQTTFADSSFRLITDVKSISKKELGLSYFSGQAATIAAIKEDTRKMAGDDSYQIDIGV